MMTPYSVFQDEWQWVHQFWMYLQNVLHEKPSLQVVKEYSHACAMVRVCTAMANTQLERQSLIQTYIYQGTWKKGKEPQLKGDRMSESDMKLNPLFQAPAKINFYIYQSSKTL